MSSFDIDVTRDGGRWTVGQSNHLLGGPLDFANGAALRGSVDFANVESANNNSRLQSLNRSVPILRSRCPPGREEFGTFEGAVGRGRQ